MIKICLHGHIEGVELSQSNIHTNRICLDEWYGAKGLCWLLKNTQYVLEQARRKFWIGILTLVSLWSIGDYILYYNKLNLHKEKSKINMEGKV